MVIPLEVPIEDKKRQQPAERSGQVPWARKRAETDCNPAAPRSSAIEILPRELLFYAFPNRWTACTRKRAAE